MKNIFYTHAHAHPQTHAHAYTHTHTHPYSLFLLKSVIYFNQCEREERGLEFHLGQARLDYEDGKDNLGKLGRIHSNLFKFRITLFQIRKSNLV